MSTRQDIRKVIAFAAILCFFVSNTTYGAADILCYEDTLRATALAHTMIAESIVESLEKHTKSSSAGGRRAEDIVEISPISRIFSRFTSEKDPNVLKALINIAEKLMEAPDINPDKREMLSHVILGARMRLLCQFPPASVKEQKALVCKLKALARQWQKAFEGLSQKADRVLRPQFENEYKALQHRLKAYQGLLATLKEGIEKLEANMFQPSTDFSSMKSSSAGAYSYKEYIRQYQKVLSQA